MNNSRNPRQPSALQLNQQVTSWNARYPVGSSVSYRSRSKLIGTKTTSEAWIMGGHSVMVRLEGVSGAYSIDHLKPGNPSAHNLAPEAKDETAPARRGTCRICGCTENRACILRGGIACSWHDEDHIHCNNPACVATAAYQLGMDYGSKRIANLGEFSAEDIRQYKDQADRLGIKVIWKTSGTGATTV